MQRLALAGVLALAGCAPWLTPEQVADRLDPDADGVAHPEDCDSSRSDVHPGADEVCDGVDNNCDGDIDEAEAIDATRWYLDEDDDMYGTGEGVWACAAPTPAHVEAGGDCDDTRDGVNPDGTEICNDHLDNDCDGTANECVFSGLYEAGVHADLFGTGGTSDEYGYAPMVANLDDTGGPDLLVGSRFGLGTGAAHVFYGPIVERGNLNTTSADASVGLGSATPADFATRLANAGDLYGSDSTDVVVIGAPYGGSAGHGSFYLLSSGASLSGDVYADFWRHTSGSTGDRLGSAVAGLSDVDGDGDDELLVSAPGADVGAAEGGAVRLYHGPASSLAAAGTAAQITGVAGCELGTSLTAGDLDADGVEDIVIGSAFCDLSGTATGAVHLVSGTVLGLHAADDIAFATLEGTEDSEFFGYRLAIGDANGDGADDLWVAAPGARSPVSPTDVIGAAYLFLGPIDGSLTTADADVVIRGVETNYEFAQEVTSVPDLNGDGADELLIGSPGHAESTNRAIAPTGAAFLFYSPHTDRNRDDAEAKFYGAWGTLGMGGAMAAEDLDGDGVADLILGGPPQYADLGQVAIYLGVGQ